MKRTAASILCLGLALAGAHRAGAWNYEGHHLINQLALASLPTNFPAFCRAPAAAARIAFLAGEPDRWRNSQDLSFKHWNEPEHYFDLEQLADYGLKPEGLPIFRYDFAGQLAVIRQAHPEKFAPIDPAKNADHTRQLIGFLPWAITESYSKAKSSFSYLRTFQKDGGTPEEISNAEQSIIYVMGVMGHYVGDASQPLHNTLHHHGWLGANPEHYSTNGRIHSWIDGGFFNKFGAPDAKALQQKLRPARIVKIHERDASPQEMFQAVMAFISDGQKMVEPLYRLDRDGKLSDNGEEGRAFLEGQLLKGAQMLGDIWYSAWKQAEEDTYLGGELRKRQN